MLFMSDTEVDSNIFYVWVGRNSGSMQEALNNALYYHNMREKIFQKCKSGKEVLSGLVVSKFGI